jgi:uncharacterized protein YhfF
MAEKSAVEAFWAAYCATRTDVAACREDSYDAWSFGDSAQMADELGGFVLAGVKTATAGLAWEDEHFGWLSPVVGARSVILDGMGRPFCIIETTAVAYRPFEAVDAEFARLEGEGFRGVDDWRDAHWRYFSRRCHEIGRVPTMQMPVICQQFRVVYPPG